MVELPRLEPMVLADLQRIGEDPSQLAWQPFRPGVEIHRLYQLGADGHSAAFLRYAPGSHVPRHHHLGFEHIYVLAGAQEDERGRYPTGTLLVNPPGSAHSVRSPEGCLVLAIWERPVVFDEH
jgi:anti-sigma factor ChrR (cupin superfamily)